MRITRTKGIRASEDIVTEAAADLLFEAEDVAELITQVTGEDVAVDADPDTQAVTFTVGDDEYVVEPDGDEELVESCTRVTRSRNRRPVSASTNRPMRKIPRK